MLYTVPAKNRKRREVIGGAFADMGKFVATAGTVAVFVAGKLTASTTFVIAAAVLLFLVTSYFIVPKDKEETN